VPLAGLLAAWLAWDVIGSGAHAALARRAVGAALLVGLALTPWASAPFGRLVPPPAGPERLGVLRPELPILARELFTRRPDPNRDVIEWIRARTAPGDEILVTYEDVPFLFYTELRVRGGIGAFRVLDERSPPPRFAVLRRAPFVHPEPFREALERGRWRIVRLPTPDAVWGNNPDPAGQYWSLTRDPEGVRVAERLEPY
jgi:hypothetical protein